MQWFVAIGLLIMPISAQAYLDPGTGSLIIQAAIAGAVGIGMTVKLYWFRIKRFLSGATSGTNHEQSQHRESER